MSQGYIPPGQEEPKQRTAKTGRSIPRFLYVIALVIGVMGVIAEKNPIMRPILLMIAAFSANRLISTSKKKRSVPPAIPSRPTYKAPERYKNPESTLPMLPRQIGGVPVAYQYQEVDIAMTSEVVNDFSVFRPGDVITFIPEPSNPYDPKAIQLLANNQLLGYVYRGKIQDMLNDFLKFGEPVHGMVFSVRPDEKKITYSVGFYRPARPKSHGKMLASGRLTTNAGVEAQDNISVCDEGDEVSVDYDYEKERYEVSYMDYIGCLPKKLEQYADTATFVIDEVGENESGKQYVVVGAYAVK